MQLSRANLPFYIGMWEQVMYWNITRQKNLGNNNPVGAGIKAILAVIQLSPKQLKDLYLLLIFILGVGALYL